MSVIDNIDSVLEEAKRKGAPKLADKTKENQARIDRLKKEESDIRNAMFTFKDIANATSSNQLPPDHNKVYKLADKMAKDAERLINFINKLEARSF